MTSNLESEILEQPAVIARLLDSPAPAEVARAIRAADPHYIAIAARGTSDNAARYAQYLFGVHLGLPVALAAPSISTLYGHPPRYRKTVMIGISQSGKSVDVAQVVTDAKAQGALTISLTNDPDSPMARDAAHHIDLNAGAERSVAATKTYTAELTALALIAAHYKGDQAMLEDLRQLPAQVEATLGLLPMLRDRAERFRFMTHCVTLGRGYNYATAFEIALKLKELTYVIAEPYSSADFRHGPKAMIEEDFPVIAIAPGGAAFADMRSLLEEMRNRRADLTVISGEQTALECGQLRLALPLGVPEWLSPVISVIPGQLLALMTAITKGYDPDSPRGLTKVTVTR